ncbi:hypothetical protein AM493_15035 [Flavobacterium akiainvivens]|uniref:type II site-specific deoxyribonuclease n=1 Tax=Flavobacterium akiainvivens TaxID=1202724 RepID=A0A0M8MCD1_9FLAO|nr:TdeIII family type II restriction endonuclease [Flavobacterium akiainvivens]KOS07205.1 hypothetical protein AM493_15035 [Flavobacterium akiainvivens]SFQ72610.1 Type II restriction endonuclease, TdeIII [Flavobacterium akiainvivens]
MPLTEQEIFDTTRNTAINSIRKYAVTKLKKKKKFQILDLIMPNERKVRSIVGGLETSLGTTLWEPLARNLAELNGFEVVKNNLQMPTNMPHNLHNTLQTIIASRRNGSKQYDARASHLAIKSVCEDFIQNPIDNFKKAPSGHGVDVWLIKDGVNYFFDTKTVQPNVGDYSKYLIQLLTWYAYFYSQFPEGLAEARIVFPYNPYGQLDFWDNTVNRGRPLEQINEAWVQNEFWDFCTGFENSYSVIHKAFVDIAESGDLKDILEQIFN